eukprot:5023128-Amphidinium_carterae.1
MLCGKPAATLKPCKLTHLTLRAWRLAAKGKVAVLPSGRTHQPGSPLATVGRMSMITGRLLEVASGCAPYARLARAVL